MNTTISDELLNAYIDNELDEKDAQNIEAKIKNDSELRNKVRNLQHLKMQMRASYASLRAPLRNHQNQNKSVVIPASIAASITLLVGISSGWLGHQYINNDSKTITRANKADAGEQQLLGIKLQPVKAQDNKIIIHLAQNDKQLFDKALAKAEALLERFDRLKENGVIQVLANSNGMDILRKDKSPYKTRIIKMMQQHNNIEFIACQNTIQRLKDNGIDVQLINGVEVHGPVINEIVNHLQDGWTYIKI